MVVDHPEIKHSSLQQTRRDDTHSTKTTTRDAALHTGQDGAPQYVTDTVQLTQQERKLTRCADRRQAGPGLPEAPGCVRILPLRNPRRL